MPDTNSSDRPYYGYDAPDVQNFYSARGAEVTEGFLLPLLKPGMSLLDCGCGPGTITLGLADAISPGQATGIDLEPGMIERAKAFAKERAVENVTFQVDDITDLSFPDDSFDAVFTSAVLEHLEDPVKALRELRRVVKSDGIVAIINTDWGDPLISPVDESVSKFFELFERGFNRIGGSLNRGRHLRLMMIEAGFEIVDFEASFANAKTPEAVQTVINGYIAWMNNLPLFDQAIELGWVTRAELNDIANGMKKWSEIPNAFLAPGRIKALGKKG